MTRTTDRIPNNLNNPMTLVEIAKHLGCDVREVQYAVEHHAIEPVDRVSEHRFDATAIAQIEQAVEEPIPKARHRAV